MSHSVVRFLGLLVIVPTYSCVNQSRIGSCWAVYSAVSRRASLERKLPRLRCPAVCCAAAYVGGGPPSGRKLGFAIHIEAGSARARIVRDDHVPGRPEQGKRNIPHEYSGTSIVGNDVR